MMHPKHNKYKDIMSLYHTEHREFIRFTPTIERLPDKKMILDPNKYIVQVPTIKKLYELNKDRKTLDEMLDIITLSTSVPYLATALWIQCLYGTSAELQAKIKSFQAFYKYTDIVPLVYENDLTNA